MLATRPSDTEHSHWSFGKYFPTPGKATTSPRMSDQFDSSLSTQPDWQGQYPYLQQPAGAVYPHSSDQNHANTGVVQPHPGAEGGNLRLDVHDERQTGLPQNQHHGMRRLGVLEINHPPRIQEPSGRKEDSGAKTAGLLLDDNLPASETPGIPMNSSQLNSISSTGKNSESSHGRYGMDDQAALKEEADDLIDDDMGEGDVDPSHPQTTAERVAARRKMKRFRLTHQQTRFLTSEFAKQPHPDAAHRERLSREIPGLSPRQVQVWFQNRRAKIKRLNADDRDRMIKMRAVPDDFDNVQALHSPYGAVHGMAMPLAPPVEFGNSSYGNPMMRPLMVDVRRQDGSDQISPTGLTPSFGSVAFNHSGGIGASGVIPQMSPSSSDRYPPGSHQPASIPGGHNSIDSTLQAHRHGMRPIQPFHLRDPMSRPRSESLQSPLRSGVPWKADSMDYYMYQGPNTHHNITDRSPLNYQPAPLSQAASGGIGGGLDRSAYSGNANPQPSGGMNYSTFQHSPEHRSRARPSSASLPLNNVDHYRVVQSPTQASSNRDTAPSSHYGTSSAYPTTYPAAPLSAPLTAPLPTPLETSQARPANGQPALREYPDSQIGVSAVTTNDFSQTIQAGLNSQEPRSDVRSLFQNDYSHNHERSENYGEDLSNPVSFKRERSYTVPGGSVPPMSESRPPSHHTAA